VRPSSLDRKLVFGILLLFLVPTVLVGLLLMVLYQRGLYADNPAALALTILVGLLAMLIYLGAMTYAIGRSLVGTLREIQLGTELIGSVNPDHRLTIKSGDELEWLAEEINMMAERIQGARAALEQEIAQATGALALERGKLSTVLGALGEGVLLATPEGRISLANRSAQGLLGSGLLGRSVFEFFDREKLAYFLDRLRNGASTVERFSLHPAGGAVLQAVMTPFFSPEQRLEGFILVLRDVTAPVRSEETLRQILSEKVRELRGPLASIRSLSESLTGTEEGAAGPEQRLVRAIHSEALRLSEVVRQLAEASAQGQAGPPWHFEQIAPADLLFMTLRRIERPGDEHSQVDLEGPLPALASVAAETTTLSAALAQLAGEVLARRAPDSRVWVRPLLKDRLLQVSIGAEGQPALSELEAALGRTVNGTSRAVSVREVIQQHAGEAWSFADEGRFGFGLTLPTLEATSEAQAVELQAAGEDRFVGIGLVSGWSGGDEVPDRPEFYDFSLLERLELEGVGVDRERPLEALTYVVLDVETTGLQPEGGDQIVSLAGVRIREGAVRRAETFDALINPRRRIPKRSIQFHGIRPEMVTEAPTIDVVLPAFLKFAEGSVLVGHEVSFDLRFLDRDATRLGLPPVSTTHPVLDTLLLSEMIHGSLPGHRLEAVAARLGVEVRGRHSALGDALTTAEIFVRLAELLKRRGTETLGQALEISQRARNRRRFSLPAEPG
jgi:DNA polymerase III subunit epsilon